MNLILAYKKAAALFSQFIIVLPVVLRAILAMEAAFPGAGQGNAKRDAIRDALEAALAVVADGKIDFKTELWPVIEKFIATKVKAFNDAGWPPAEPDVVDAAGGGATPPTA